MDECTWKILGLLLLNLCCIGCQENQINTRILRKAEKCDTVARTGDQVAVHYTCKLVDGRLIKSTYDQGTKEPHVFTIGEREVIIGLEYGLTSMCVGEKRFVEVPPRFAFGEEGKPPAIAPNTTLYFEVELLEVRRSILKNFLNRYLLSAVYIVTVIVFILLIMCKCLPNLPSQKKRVSKRKKTN